MNATLIVATLSYFVIAPVSPVAAFETKISKDGHQVHWTDDVVEVHVSSEMPEYNKALLQAGHVAEQAWRKSEYGPRISVSSGAKGTWGFTPKASNENGLYLLEKWPFADNQLATTITTTLANTGEVVDSDILVNGEHDLDFLRAPQEDSSTFDLGVIVTHEFGHMLGLGHTKVQDATMWENLEPGATARRELSTDDLDGVRAVYERFKTPAAEEALADAALSHGDPALAGGISDRETITAAGCAAKRGFDGAVLLLFVAGLMLSARRWRELCRIVFFLSMSTMVGCALDVAGSADRPVIEGTVTKLSTRWSDGILWTSYRVQTEDGEDELVRLPGGTLDGYVQQVGSSLLPADGDSVRVRVFYDFEVTDSTSDPQIGHNVGTPAWILQADADAEHVSH